MKTIDYNEELPTPRLPLLRHRRHRIVRLQRLPNLQLQRGGNQLHFG